VHNNLQASRPHSQSGFKNSRRNPASVWPPALEDYSSLRSFSSPVGPPGMAHSQITRNYFAAGFRFFLLDLEATTRGKPGPMRKSPW
jgi:hypothetical protein